MCRMQVVCYIASLFSWWLTVVKEYKTINCQTLDLVLNLEQKLQGCGDKCLHCHFTVWLFNSIIHKFCVRSILLNNWNFPFLKIDEFAKCLIFYRSVCFFHFIISLPVIRNYLYFIYSTHIPVKFLKFNEFNKILKRENSYVTVDTVRLFNCWEYSCSWLKFI